MTIVLNSFVIEIVPHGPHEKALLSLLLMFLHVILHHLSDFSLAMSSMVVRCAPVPQQEEEIIGPCGSRLNVEWVDVDLRSRNRRW